MRISNVMYNRDGDLLMPFSVDADRGVAPGGAPTTEPGFYHRFKAEGTTVHERDVRAAHFLAELKSVPGFAVLTTRSYTVHIGDMVRHGLDVLYVVEHPVMLKAPALRSA